MRIIAGAYKGRRLESPPGQDVRPTTDRVKEALFSMIEGHLSGARVIDLFAGSGGLGLEALSRGASRCWFGDLSAESIRVLRNNVAHCGAGNKAEILRRDFRAFLAQFPGQADVIFLDPPYGENLWDVAVRLISTGKILAEGGVLVMEHPRSMDFPLEYFGYTKIKERRYGTVVLSIFMC